MGIPAAAHSQDLSKKRKPGRPPLMEPALKKARDDDDEVLSRLSSGRIRCADGTQATPPLPLPIPTLSSSEVLN